MVRSLIMEDSIRRGTGHEWSLRLRMEPHIGRMEPVAPTRALRPLRRGLSEAHAAVSASPPADEVLLAARDAASFETFYLRHVEALLVYFARRTGDPELAADLTAETFAAALAARRRLKPARGSARPFRSG